MLSVLNASLRRLSGDYRGSNTALDRAYGLNDELLQGLSELSAASLLNPGASPIVLTRWKWVLSATSRRSTTWT